MTFALIVVTGTPPQPQPSAADKTSPECPSKQTEKCMHGQPNDSRQPYSRAGFQSIAKRDVAEAF